MMKRPTKYTQGYLWPPLRPAFISNPGEVLRIVCSECGKLMADVEPCAIGGDARCPQTLLCELCNKREGGAQ